MRRIRPDGRDIAFLLMALAFPAAITMRLVVDAGSSAPVIPTEVVHQETRATPPVSVAVEGEISTVPVRGLGRPPSTTTTVVQRNAWDRLADCESGAWDARKVPIAGTAHWDDRRDGYGGGLHFTQDTWSGNRRADFPAHAYEATREQQIVVAERVLHVQGPGAWPTCSIKVGLR